METYVYIMLLLCLYQFKSYYVVWKQRKFYRFLDIQTSLNRTMQYGNVGVAEFNEYHEESLNRTMQYGNRCSRFVQLLSLLVFKSYYVVWKLSWRHRELFKIPSLNRTMQYGNDTYFLHILTGQRCGLNRTMQYGNFFIILCFYSFFRV